MTNCCARCRKDACARRVPIFSTLNECELTDIADMIKHREYKKNDVIFSEGGKAETLYFVNEGKIKLYKYNKDGKEQIFHILSDGDFFGELNLLKESKYGFNAKTLSNSKICTLGKDELKEILMSKPEISIKVLEILSERLAKVESLAQNLSTNDIDTRIAYLLIDLGEKYGQEEENKLNINLPINREDMANYIGVTRETISRKLKKLEYEGVIKMNGTKNIVLLNKKELEDYI